VARIIPHGFRRAFRDDGISGAPPADARAVGPGWGAALLHRVVHLLWLALACAGACGAAERAEGESARLRFRVVIEAPQPLRSQLESGLNLVRWQRDERMTIDSLRPLVAEARAETERAAAAEGYFSAIVGTAIEPGEPVTVRISVAPGPRTRVGAVELRFRGAVAERPGGDRRMAAVRRTWPLPVGSPFRQEQWEAAKLAAVAELSQESYAAASIAHSEARVDPGRQSVSLVVELDSGPPFRFGALHVTGTRRYPESIVESLNPIKPGDPYDASRLALYQRRLLETGYFATAQMTVDRDPAAADAAPLRVNVIEGRSQRVDTGVSVSTDTRLGVQLNYSNQDWWDSALRLRSALKLDARTQIFDTSIDTPPRPGGVWNTVTARYEATDIQNQRTEGTVLGASYNWGVERTPSQVALSAHTERQVIVGSNTERNDALFLGFRQVFRYTDDPLRPRRGVLGSVQLGSSLPWLATQDFVRGTGKLNLLVPLGTRADIAARIEGGVVLADSRSGIPSAFLFRTGGDQTIRGYAYQSIGVPQGLAIVGGRYLAVGSVEATYWVVGDWGVAAFVDAGDAFDNRNAFDPAFGYGMGVRWRSPIGPFRADIAYGERSESVRLHFSVGFNF
jgi:translocation and assembly module TamA